jgi:CheY-like chemotaxis protein
MNEQHSSSPKADQQSPPIIFVVDDSVELGEMVGMVLADAGYDPRVFSNPLEALQVLESGGPYPSLLISDFRMPGINGLELIHRCKLIHPTLKVIAASANMLDEEMEKYPFRPERILAKPYTTHALLNLVKSLLPE